MTAAIPVNAWFCVATCITAAHDQVLLRADGCGIENAMSAPIGFAEARAVFRIVAECRELWLDPDQWQQHFLCSASDLITLPVGLCVPADPEDEGPVQITWADSTSPAAVLDAQSPAAAILQRPFPGPLPGPAPLFPGPDPNETSRRRNDPGCLDGLSYSAKKLDDGETPHVLAFGALAQPASPRECRLIELLHGEIVPLIGTRLATPIHISQFGLSPRLREVLHLVRGGSSEKEIVDRLSLSRATVSEHLQRLYRHFVVHGRAELMAYLLAQIPAARKPLARPDRSSSPQSNMLVFPGGITKGKLDHFPRKLAAGRASGA